ncbi:hypothetical protein BKA70DRAFT_1228163 [Coprinopsis sp. MPI-PUGE-AT-0042]|nr:hypothetical protein BKA70DRAFT_1228163 [Coprinopsis sp. MPI-PUGE-AT-0042]
MPRNLCQTCEQMRRLTSVATTVHALTRSASTCYNQLCPCHIDAPHVDAYPVLALSIVKNSRLVYPTDASSGLRQPSSHIGNLFSTKSTSLGMTAIGSSLGATTMPILSRSLLLKLDLHAHGPKAEGTAGEYEGQMDSAWNIGTRLYTASGQDVAYRLATHLCILLLPFELEGAFCSKVNLSKLVKGLQTSKPTSFRKSLRKPSLGPTEPPQTEDFFSNLPHPRPAAYLCTLIPPESRIRPVFGESAKHEYTSWALDAQTLAKTQPSYAPNRTNAESVGRLGLEWAAWYEFQKEQEALGDVYTPLLVDMFNGSMRLLLSEEELGNTWEPTMTLSNDFKFPISWVWNTRRELSASTLLESSSTIRKVDTKSTLKCGLHLQRLGREALKKDRGVNLRNAKKGEKGKL